MLLDEGRVGEGVVFQKVFIISFCLGKCMLIEIYVKERNSRFSG